MQVRAWLEDQKESVVTVQGQCSAAATCVHQCRIEAPLQLVAGSNHSPKHACISCGELGEFPVRPGHTAGTKQAPIAFLVCCQSDGRICSRSQKGFCGILVRSRLEACSR